jgi:hypothetical protein
MKPSDRIHPESDEFAALHTSFRRRRFIAFAATGLWVAIVLMIIAFGMAATTVGETAIIVTWLVNAITVLMVWRCPRCGEHLGRRLTPTHCSHCFLQLS